MIMGVGIDVVDIANMREQLQDPATQFVELTFTAAEKRDAFERATHSDPALHLGARFAAKEALIKAWSGARWGDTPQLASVDMREIEVTLDQHGRPRLALHGNVAWAMSQLGPIHTHLSMSHDGGYANAVVVLERAEEAPR